MVHERKAVIPVKDDFFIGSQYWRYQAKVYVLNDVIQDTDIVILYGRDEDDFPIEPNEIIEDHAKYLAERKAQEIVDDLLSDYSSLLVTEE